jgi:hypothetical protein
LQQAGLPEAAIQLVPTRDREMVSAMLRAVEYIDVIVPRGGKGLVGLVQREARVPVFAHLEGICHVYADGDADLEKARRVVLNAKTRRTGICGAAECLLIDRAFFARHGVGDYRIVESAGATEGAPAAGAAEIVVDITTTGATLAANHLAILRDGVILKSQAQLAAALTADWSGDRLATARRLLSPPSPSPAPSSPSTPASVHTSSTSHVPSPSRSPAAIAVPSAMPSAPVNRATRPSSVSSPRTSSKR